LKQPSWGVKSKKERSTQKEVLSGWLIADKDRFHSAVFSEQREANDVAGLRLRR
jgi:hypothetical protein